MPANFPEIRSRTVEEIVLQDLRQMQDQNGQIITDIVNILREKNQLLQDMTFRTANRGNDRYWINVTTSLPKAWWRRYNRGVPPSKGTYASIEETCGTLMSASEIDALMAEEQDSGRAFRYMQDEAHIQSLNESMTEYLFYGDKAINPEGFDGFNARYNTLNTAETVSKNVIDCGGKQGKNLTSVWLICWGDGVFGFHPKHTPLGITRRDEGKIWTVDDNGYRISKYLTTFMWSLGLVIADWRCVVRLCNIDVDELVQATAGGIGDPEVRNTGALNLLMQMQRALGLVENVRNANTRAAFYMNSDVKNGLNMLSARTNSNVVRVQNSFNDYGDRNSWSSFGGVPLRCVDRLSSQEDQVTA